jgi:trafficking protein particle complex subunit 2
MVDQDFGLLQAVDEQLAMYGWLTNTGIKIIIVVDMEGRPATAIESKASIPLGLRDADLKPVRQFLTSTTFKLINH